jgi:hypothetical protein
VKLVIVSVVAIAISFLQVELLCTVDYTQLVAPKQLSQAHAVQAIIVISEELLERARS